MYYNCTDDSNLKKFLALILCCFILFDLFGHALFFLHIREIIRENFKETRDELTKEELTLLVFLKSEFRTEEEFIRYSKEGELNIGGKLYDVHSAKVSNDSLFILCKYDEEENNLYSKYGALEKEKRLKIRFHQNYYIVQENIFPILIEWKFYSICISINYQSNKPEIPAPPPKYYS